ncbi:MAG TPA: hypothetical protein VMT46_09060 [Anaerolineaceae bacterium]|nr:hypothetical protein [Anaerolineaceae bacterium]
MAQQTILFTVMPRGTSVNPATLPVSVLISPRLEGGNALGQFPDWLDWTQKLKNQPLELTFGTGVKIVTLKAKTNLLRPELWAAMFNETTYVRSPAMPDYAKRAIFSYPVRLALSTLKNVYQEAGLTLGLPDETDGESDKEHQRSPRRLFMQSLLSGLAVNWNDESGERLRKQYRDGFVQIGKAAGGAAPHYDPAWLAPDGTLKILPPASTPAAIGPKEFLAGQFAVYSHMPQGAPVHDNPPDFDTLIDFHQALSSLNTYPELLRALGLVLDFELPADFLPETPVNVPAHFAVVDVPHHIWAIATQAVPKLPPLQTAYLNISAGDPGHPWKVFTTAPGFLGGGLPDLEVFFGLLNLDPAHYGLAQVDVESGMHKTTNLAEAWQDDRLGLAFPEYPQIFDESTTLPSLRSGGFSLFADGRALRLLQTLQNNQQFDQDLKNKKASKRPFFAEDLVHGYRLDVWDAATGRWHSLHRRIAAYQIGEETFNPGAEVEGFTQLAAAQAAPDPDNPPPNDLYLNESVARWAGWSLSAPFPGKGLSRDPDPDKALVEDPNHPANEPATPFKMTTEFKVASGSLPSLRFGRRYRLRARTVDICGNSLNYDDPLANLLAILAGLPRDPEGTAYLRYEPVAAPTVVLRDVRGVTDPGSQLNRLVIRTYNDAESKDGDPADLTASERWIVPPSTSVEIGERLGMFDKNGKLDTSAAMYNLIGQREQGRLNQVTATVAGQEQSFPLESGALDSLPYLPDVLSRGAALRDLPGSPEASLASVAPGLGPAADVPYQPLADANPRGGSALLISFDSQDDWQKLLPFRIVLADGTQRPAWDPQNRVLSVFLPKGTRTIVPLSSYLSGDDLKLMGVWQWLREYIDLTAIFNPEAPDLDHRRHVERIAQILQRALEGGHWMITPPRLLTLIHAVQQPLGHPAFTSLTVQRTPYGGKDRFGIHNERIDPDPQVLQTASESRPTAESELAPITAWRKPGSPEAFLLGGIQVHAASTEKVDLLAEWLDPYDDETQPRLEGEDYRQRNTARVDEIPIPTTREGLIAVDAGTANYRLVAYYDADHDLLCMVRAGDQLGSLESGVQIYSDAAPRHYFNDTRRHRVTYTTRATSRYREYFPADQDLDFTRQSEPVVVDVPASARPTAPKVAYAVPAFGWERQAQSNLKRSVRFGNSLRIYLERPWFSSGDGELLGIVLYDDYANGMLADREMWKPYVTQWGADPIWIAPGLPDLPRAYTFPNRVADEAMLSLPGRTPGRVAVAGFTVDFDFASQMWFTDLSLEVPNNTGSPLNRPYTPFIRLALARYQPFAIPDARLSAVILADYAQLTPERSAVVTADPYHPRTLRLTVSGPAPAGPAPEISGTRPSQAVHVPTQITVTIQRRDPAISTDLGWEDAPAGAAAVHPLSPGIPGTLLRWTGTVDFATVPEPGQYRLLIREYEYLSANYTIPTAARRGRVTRREQPKRLIYAETVEIDTALIGGPATNTGTVV